MSEQAIKKTLVKCDAPEACKKNGLYCPHEEEHERNIRCHWTCKKFPEVDNCKIVEVKEQEED